MIATLFVAAEAAAGQGSAAPTSTEQMLSMFVALLVVLAVAIALAWFWKRMMPSSLLNSSGMDVIASRYLGNKEKLTLIKVGERYLLLGVTPHTIQSLAEFNVDELPQALTATKKESQSLWPLRRNNQS